MLSSTLPQLGLLQLYLLFECMVQQVLLHFEGVAYFDPVVSGRVFEVLLEGLDLAQVAGHFGIASEDLSDFVTF